jgi:hypothetical protein
LPWPPSIASEAIESDDEESPLREVEEEENLDALDQDTEQKYETLLWEVMFQPK